MSERDRNLAIMEGFRNESERGYFSVRAEELDTSHNRNIFGAGFDRGYECQAAEIVRLRAELAEARRDADRRESLAIFLAWHIEEDLTKFIFDNCDANTYMRRPQPTEDMDKDALYKLSGLIRGTQYHFDTMREIIAAAQQSTTETKP